VVGPAFKEMDKDGDGEASLQEFLDFAKTLTKEVRKRRRR
jgi:Ca2+-binding EF-hand superfamily protein